MDEAVEDATAAPAAYQQPPPVPSPSDSSLATLDATAASDATPQQLDPAPQMALRWAGVLPPVVLELKFAHLVKKKKK